MLRAGFTGAAMVVAATITAMTLVVGAAAPATNPSVRFVPVARTGHNMDDIVWTGTQFLYVENTTNTVWAAPPRGLPLHEFASMPHLVEETRCVLSPGTRVHAGSHLLPLA